MIRKFVKEEDDPGITHKYSRFCGGSTISGNKVILLYTGRGNTLHAVFNKEAVEKGSPNVSWGDETIVFADTEDFVNTCNDYCLGDKITDFYMFDSLKEMLKWFAE